MLKKNEKLNENTFLWNKTPFEYNRKRETEVYRERGATTQPVVPRPPTRMSKRRQRLHDRGGPVGQGRHCCWRDRGDEGGGHPDHGDGPHWHWRNRRQRGHAGQAAHTCGGRGAQSPGSSARRAALLTPSLQTCPRALTWKRPNAVKDQGPAEAASPGQREGPTE